MTTHRWILLAEDDPHDAELAKRALSSTASRTQIVVARDGEEVLNCLYHRSGFSPWGETHPGLVLLDLKMPKVDGLEVLRQMKADSRLKTIPVVVFSSSREESDLARSYGLGVNAYVVKPLEFKHYMYALSRVKEFWLEVNEPPPEAARTLDPGPPQLAGTV